MKQKIILPLILSLFLGSSVQAAKIVAEVGSKKITLSDFNKKYAEILSQTQNPPKKSVFLEDLVRFEIGVQEANKRKLQNDPLVQERVRQELYKALVEMELKNKINKIKITESDLKAWYKKNPEIRTSHILIEFKTNATKKEKAIARERAVQILAEVKKSKRPFAELVKIYTDDSVTKQTNGDVGWQSRLTVVPQYYDAAIKMKVGQIKGLVATQLGFHIIQLTGLRKYSEANKSQMRQGVFNEKRRVLFDQFFTKLKRKYTVKVYKRMLK